MKKVSCLLCGDFIYNICETPPFIKSDCNRISNLNTDITLVVVIFMHIRRSLASLADLPSDFRKNSSALEMRASLKN